MIYHARIKKKLFVAFPWVVLGREVLSFVCLFYDGNSQRLNRKWFYGESDAEAEIASDQFKLISNKLIVNCHYTEQFLN